MKFNIANYLPYVLGGVFLVWATIFIGSVISIYKRFNPNKKKNNK